MGAVSNEGKNRPCRTFGELDLASRIEKHESALSAQELAKFLNCTRSHVLKRAKSGKIPSYRIGGMVRFDPAITADWLRSRRVG